MTKLYPMPKIEFHENTAYCMDLKFRNLFDNRIKISDPGDEYWIHTGIIQPNQTFEQAVIEWVSKWVRNNFQGIVVPDLVDEIYARDYSWNDCLEKLLELNPNCVRIEE